jgi:hypothetical protein
MACRRYLKMQKSMTCERYDRYSTAVGKQGPVKLLSPSDIQHFLRHLANLSEKKKNCLEQEAELRKICQVPVRILVLPHSFKPQPSL